MRVLGLDPGSRFTGYGIVESHGSSIRHIASGRINATSGNTFSERLAIIYDNLEFLLGEHSCSYAAIESLFVALNVQSTIKLSQARGVALLAVHHANLPLVEYAPTKIKQAVTGYGHAKKEHIQMIVAQTLNLSLNELSSDAGDALAIAICHCRTLQFESKLTSPSSRILHHHDR